MSSSQVSDYLQASGYIFDTKLKIWVRLSYDGIRYTDGAETELHIASIIDQASDITVLSTELRQRCTDWPTLYHLSGTRANILRPFATALTGDVLEIGAGCGAITRYLGECGANVLALEGSLRRAAIVRSRTRDLKNVTVLAERFDQFECDQRFDVITLIGVLEYANLFTAGESPALSMLKQVRSLLKPEGRLIIAIENQLGLKYFAGAPEDHLGQPMYGIEGRYRKDQPQTFGRKVLKDILNDADFASAEFLAPFPDYKLPVSIVTEEGINNKEFDAAALAWQSARLDPQLPVYCNFSLELAWPEIFKNGLALDVANSFLIVASPETNQLIETSVLAYHYNAERKACYCKQTKFKYNNGRIEVEYNLLIDEGLHYSSDLNGPIRFVRPENDRYVYGSPLFYEFIQAVRTDGWSISQITQLMQRYISMLVKLSSDSGLTLNTASPYAVLPGEFFDAVPQNIIVRGDESVALIDKEWVLSDGIEFGYLIFRSLLLLLSNAQKVSPSNDGPPLTRGKFVRQVLSSLGIGLTETDFARYAILESTIRESVTGGLVDDPTNWWPDQPLITDGRSEQIQMLTARIELTEKALAEAQQFAITRLARIEAIESMRIWHFLRRIGLIKKDY